MNTRRRIVVSRRWALVALAAIAALVAGTVGVLYGDGPLSMAAAALPFLDRASGTNAAAQTPATTAAQEVIRAMLTVTDPHDPVSWQQRVDVLSTAEGRSAWQSMLDQGWWDAVEAREAVTGQVIFEEARQVGEVVAGGRPGRVVRLAGTVQGHDVDGAFERPFSFQVLMVQDAAGQWKFAYFDLQTKQGG